MLDVFLNSVRKNNFLDIASFVNNARHRITVRNAGYILLDNWSCIEVVSWILIY